MVASSRSRCSGRGRSMKSTPSRWSVLCWTQRVSSPSPTTCTGSPCSLKPWSGAIPRYEPACRRLKCRGPRIARTSDVALSGVSLLQRTQHHDWPGVPVLGYPSVLGGPWWRSGSSVRCRWWYSRRASRRGGRSDRASAAGSSILSGRHHPRRCGDGSERRPPAIPTAPEPAVGNHGNAHHHHHHHWCRARWPRSGCLFGRWGSRPVVVAGSVGRVRS
jgi:hypothetical protein